MKIMVINGPNLNMLGIRETNIYGSVTYQTLCDDLTTYAKEKGITISLRQSNHEGDLIDYVQEAYFEKYDGIVINPGGYTHTSIALHDAIKAIAPLPCVEVHISDIDKREAYRQISYIESCCIATIKGHGIKGYTEAIEIILRK